MWGLGKHQRYWLYEGTTDMRRGFDGLSGLVGRELGHQNVLSGDAFVFLNRRCTQMKILVWEGGGFLIYHKRLERGTFERGGSKIDGSLRWDELVLMVEGVVMSGLKRRKRFELGVEKR